MKEQRAAGAQQGPTAASSTSTSTQTAPAAGSGNAALAAEARTEEGTAAGMANYQASLGAWLGGELYQAVAPHLTLESVSGYAQQAVSAGAAGLVGQLGSLEVNGEIDTDAVDSFGEAVGERCAEAAAAWLETADGKAMAGKLGGWADANPELVATVAVLAAAGAYLADAEIPELQREFGLAEGLTAEVGAKLGSLRSVALQELRGKLELVSGPLVAAVSLVRDTQGAVGGELSAKLGDDAQHLQASGKLDQQGLELWGLEGLTPVGKASTLSGRIEGGRDTDPTVEASIVTQEGELTTTRKASYDSGAGLLKISDIQALGLDGGGSLTRTLEGGSDGSSRAALAWKGATGLEGLTGSASYEEKTAPGSAAAMRTEQLAKLGLDYSREDLEKHLKLGLHGDIDSKGQGTVSGSVEKTFDSGTTGKLDGSFKLQDPRLYQVGAAYGFRSEDEFSTWLAEYTYSAESGQHDVDLMIEEKLGEIYARIQHKMVITDQGLRTDSSVQGAWFVDPKTALIAGAHYRVDDAGRETWLPEAGIQVDNVPITMTYDTKTKAVMVGLTLQFGR